MFKLINGKCCRFDKQSTERLAGMDLLKASFILALLITLQCQTDVQGGVVHIHADTDLRKGFWKQKVIWKLRAVKDWQVRKYIVPVWKKVWGPVEVKEWVPYPKAPPSSWNEKH